MRARSASGGVGDGFVFLEAGPLSRGVVHFKDCVHQHGGAAGAVGFGEDLRVLAQLDLDDLPLLRARVLCETGRRKRLLLGTPGLCSGTVGDNSFKCLTASCIYVLFGGKCTCWI